MVGKAILLGALILYSAACSSSPTSEVPNVNAKLPIPYELKRLSTTQFEVIIDTSTLSGFSLPALTLTIANGTASPFAHASGNSYKTTVTSSITSGEVPMTFAWGEYASSVTALVFPNIHADWDQPEAVPGYVNTDGWEDSPEISPDGDYLAVSTYSPVSIFQCIIDGAVKTAASCSANSYPSLLAERPNFPGAPRILSSTSIDHTINWLNLPNSTSAFPPVSSYVFKKQSDGSFRDPVAVYVDWDAYTWGAPFGFHFRKKVSSGVYQAYGAFGDPVLANGNKLQSFQLDLNQPTVVLGKVASVSGTPTKSNWAMTPISIPGLATQAGNPASSVYGPTGDGYLFWDDESLAANSRDLYFATETASGTFGSKQTVGLSQAGVDEYQPYFFQQRLHFSLLHAAIYSSQLTASADPSQSGSWSALRLELGTDSGHTHIGRIISMGEPSLHLDSSGRKWMYFAYAIQPAGSLNLNIGRVRSRLPEWRWIKETQTRRRARPPRSRVKNRSSAL